MSGTSPNQQLTVAHLLPWAGLGGVEIATLRLIDATRHSVRHVAFCLPDAEPVKEAFEKQGVETVSYIPPEPSIRHATRYYRDSMAVARSLKAAGTNLVHFAEEKAAYHNSLAAKLAGVRMVCHVRVSHPTLSKRDRISLLPVRDFIFVSQEARNTFALSLPDSRGRVIYDAVVVPESDGSEHRASILLELGIPEGCAVVGTVARVSPQKDYFTLADAAVKVLNRHPNTRFLIVGDNSQVELNRQHFANVARKLSELGIMDKFVFTGHRDDTPRLISAMDFCVLSTHREGFPLSILESMALRKAVIATSVGGIPEIVMPGVTGFLHRHEDSQELAEHILSLIENPESASTMGTAARELVRNSYSRDKFASDVLKAYSDVMR